MLYYELESCYLNQVKYIYNLLLFSSPHTHLTLQLIHHYTSLTINLSVKIKHRNYPYNHASSWQICVSAIISAFANIERYDCMTTCAKLIQDISRKILEGSISWKNICKLNLEHMQLTKSSPNSNVNIY